MQGIDFSATQKNVALKSNTYGQGRIDYFLSLEVATHIALLERNEAGKRMRRHLLGVQNSYLRSLEQKQNGLKLLPEETKVQQLETEVNQLKSQLLEVTRTNLSYSIRQRNLTLMDLVKEGVCTQNIRTKYIYKLTDHGKALGYKQNKHGTILPPIG